MHKQKSAPSQQFKVKKTPITTAIAAKIIREYDDVLDLKHQFEDAFQNDSFLQTTHQIGISKML